MFENILVLTDFSAYSRKFLECIDDLPEVKNVVILNVVSRKLKTGTWDPILEVKKAETRLVKEKNHIKSSSINVTVKAISVMMKGDIPLAIQRVADEENVQLIVMGARGNSFIQSTALGSMTRNFLHIGNDHLLIMRYKMPDDLGSGFAGDKAKSSKVAEPPKGLQMLDKFCPKILSKVLIPTDFSQPAEAVVSLFKSKEGVGEIVLLHVISKGESAEEVQTAINDATEKLNNISRQLGNEGAKVTPCIEVGSPTDEICEIADKEDVSLIAMSSVGETGWRAGRIGSVTYDVANYVNRPVLIVRPKVVYNLASSI
jgi:nucleotide-binding universal stress UspA family protein